MKALSIRQPWAWMILHANKDIENRTWATSFRGRILIHASKAMTRREYEDARIYAKERNWLLPGFDAFERGGIVGSVEIVDCVQDHSSPWFEGPFGFVLRNPEPMNFWPAMGKLGIFYLPSITG